MNDAPRALTDDDVKHQIGRHWGSRASEYNQSPWRGPDDPAHREAWSELLRAVTGPDALDVLDVGCGPGHLTASLADLGHRVTGVDAAPEMLDLARERMASRGLAVTLRLGDAESLEDADGTYDLVTERHVLWTMPNPSRALREWQRVLRPGGRVALIEGHWAPITVHRTGQSGYDEAVRLRVPFSDGFRKAELEALLVAHGFRDVGGTDLDVPRLWPGIEVTPRFVVVGRRPESLPGQGVH